jgi:hypothetical protein
MTTTWNPSDKTAGCTLSGGNLVATFAASNNGVRSIDRVHTGKYYWEVTFAGTSIANLAVGIALGTSSLSATAGNANFYCDGGSLYLNGVSASITIGSVVSGSIVCFALDADADLIWCRLGAAGNWNGNAAYNPATGVGGASIAWAGGPMGIYAWAFGSGGNCNATANFGASTFTGAVPSGFTSGFPDSTTLTNVAIATQVALEEWAMPLASAQMTQVALEAWASAGAGNRAALLTQIALEQWAALPAALVARQNAVIVINDAR